MLDTYPMQPDTASDCFEQILSINLCTNWQIGEIWCIVQFYPHLGIYFRQTPGFHWACIWNASKSFNIPELHCPTPPIQTFQHKSNKIFCKFRSVNSDIKFDQNIHSLEYSLKYPSGETLMPQMGDRVGNFQKMRLKEKEMDVIIE